MEIVKYNGVTLAYIGDAVMSLWIREKLIQNGCGSTNVLQKQSTAWVSANAQSHFLKKLLEQNFFHEDELAIVKRGRNSKTVTKAKNASVSAYRMATGLEAVIGYLYLSDKKDRLEALWHAIETIGEKK